MSKTFTYYGDLSTALDYARWRLDDTDATIRTDETGSPAPRLWDETYLALFTQRGVQFGMHLAAKQIAAQMVREITTFRESGGIGFSLRNSAYYESVSDEILQEPPYGQTGYDPAKVGHIRQKPLPNPHRLMHLSESDYCRTNPPGDWVRTFEGVWELRERC